MKSLLDAIGSFVGWMFVAFFIATFLYLYGVGRDQLPGWVVVSIALFGFLILAANVYAHLRKKAVKLDVMQASLAVFGIVVVCIFFIGFTDALRRNMLPELQPPSTTERIVVMNAPRTQPSVKVGIEAERTENKKDAPTLKNQTSLPPQIKLQLQ